VFNGKADPLIGLLQGKNAYTLQQAEEVHKKRTKYQIIKKQERHNMKRDENSASPPLKQHN